MDGIITIIVALIGAGLFSWLRDVWKDWHKRRQATQPAAVASEQAHDGVRLVNESVLAVAQSQRQLTEDNARLRAERAEVDARWQHEREMLEARHARDRASWEAEKIELKRELDAIEDKWRRALDELIEFKTRTGLGGPHE